jgi:lipoprotein-anchoring transpeptidase ErfK/SrfK
MNLRNTITKLPALAIFFLTTNLFAQNAVETHKKSHPHRVVIVSLRDRQLALLEDGFVLRTFPVTIGAAVSPSPVGTFQIINRVQDPTYYHRGTVIPAGPNNPLGPRWIGMSLQGYGIHGTSLPHSIGKAASHGCIRLRNHDIIELFPLLAVGDTLEIRTKRDQETAWIFGTEGHVTVAAAQLNVREHQSAR